MSTAVAPLALHIVAPPKSGSTFLTTLLAALAEVTALCHVKTTRYRCAHSLAVACGARHERRRAVHVSRLTPACCNIAAPTSTSDLLDEPLSATNRTRVSASASAAIFSAEARCISSSSEAARAVQWLDSTPQRWPAAEHATLNGTYTQSSRSLRAVMRVLSTRGYVLGPVRVLPIRQPINDPLRPSGSASIAAALGALGALGPARTAMRSMIVHTRHPIETLVSHFFCVVHAHVCPRRHALKSAATPATLSTPYAANGANLTAADGAAIAAFLHAELNGPQTTSVNSLVHRLERISQIISESDRVFFLDHRAPRPSTMADGRHHQHEKEHRSLVVGVSRYEHMVSEFGGWLSALVGHVLPRLPPVPRAHDADDGRGGHDEQAIVATLRARFERSFVPDGQHRHALMPGANLRMLPPHAVASLGGDARVAALLRRLGYSAWSPWPRE